MNALIASAAVVGLAQDGAPLLLLVAGASLRRGAPAAVWVAVSVALAARWASVPAVILAKADAPWPGIGMFALIVGVDAATWTLPATYARRGRLWAALVMWTVLPTVACQALPALTAATPGASVADLPWSDLLVPRVGRHAAAALWLTLGALDPRWWVAVVLAATLHRPEAPACARPLHVRVVQALDAAAAEAQEQAHPSPADVVVWPEATLGVVDVDRALQRHSSLAPPGPWRVLGAHHRPAMAWRGPVQNDVLAQDPAGRLVDARAKWAVAPVYEPARVLPAPTAAWTLNIAGQVTALPICWELLVDALLHADAGWVINIASDAAAPALAPAMARVARVRALELGVPVVGASDVAGSIVVDSTGRVVAKAPPGAAILDASICVGGER